MVILAYLALYGIPLLAAFVVFQHRGSAMAVAAAIVGGWLTMPLLAVEVGGMPAIDKDSLLCSSVLLAALLSRSRRSPSLRFRWFDLPMLAFCAAPFASSLSNGLGFYDGVSASARQVLVFGAPYLVGRLVLVDRPSMADFGRALALGAAAYAPLCLLESRLAPQLHSWVYGLPGRVGWEVVTFYGPLRWKASVFLQSPLELTPLMGVGFLWGWVLLRDGGASRIAGFPTRLVIGAAMVATLMGKSLGGVSLTLVGMLTLWLGRKLRTRWLLIALAATAPAYSWTRASGLWTGSEIVQFLDEHVSVRRAESFQTRLSNEELLIEKALQQPAFGWAGWGRSRVYDEFGADRTITDGLWVIILGCNGVFGLLAWLGVMLIPVALALARLRGAAWTNRENAVVALGATIVSLHAIDCLANAMPNPIYYMIVGGLGSILQGGLSTGRDGAGERTAKAIRESSSSPLRPRSTPEPLTPPARG